MRAEKMEITLSPVSFASVKAQMQHVLFGCLDVFVCVTVYVCGIS